MKLPPKFALLDGLSEHDRTTLESSAVRHDLKAGATIVSEGLPSTSLYLLVTGRVAIEKRVQGGEAVHRIHELGPGEPIGEVSFFDGSPRSATVRTLTQAVVIELPYDAVRLVTPLVTRLGARIAERLRISSDDELAHAQRRVAMGTLIVKIIMLLCAYAFLLAALPRWNLGGASSTYLSLPIIGAFGFVAWRFLRSTGYPLSHFGLGRAHMLGATLEAIVATPPFCALLVGLKWLLLQVWPPWRGAPLFERPDWTLVLADPNVIKLLVLYVVSSAVQEMIVRSALQVSLEEFLVGPHTLRTTLVVCALMFAASHLHISLLFATMAFFPGIFWGFLFSRRRHIVGPVLSHALIGAFVFFILGVSLP